MYKISPQYKKNVVETQTWCNANDEVLRYTIVWRWGAWISKDKPDLSKYDPEVGADPYTLADDVEPDSMDDGCSEDWEYPESWDDAKIEEFMAAWEEQWNEAPEQFGFFEEDVETWVTGPLDVEEVK